MCKVALVDRKEALRSDSLVQTVENPFVQISILVVQSRHYRICMVSTSPRSQVNSVLTWWVHDTTYYKATGRTARKMERDAILHA